MRTPAETLERLAEVAPQEWGAHVLDGRFLASAPGGITMGNPEGCDIVNGRFISWCKKQLGERGWRIAIDWQTGCDVVAMHADDPDSYVASFCPTEWQAVAECLIAVLEKENDKK